jgi:hypothetical protein
MPIKIRELVIEANDPDAKIKINMSVDIIHKKILILDNDDAERFFSKKQIDRSDLQHQQDAINMISKIMDQYFNAVPSSLHIPQGTEPVSERSRDGVEVPSPVIARSQDVERRDAMHTKTLTKTCKFCGKEFKTTRQKSIMCGSKECTRLYNREYAHKRRS